MAAALDPAAAVGVGEALPAGYDEMMPTMEPSRRRRAGVLLHPTSLRGPHGVGDLGDEALAFLHWLSDAGCTLWQVRTSAAYNRDYSVIRELNRDFASAGIMGFCNAAAGPTDIRHGWAMSLIFTVWAWERDNHWAQQLGVPTFRPMFSMPGSVRLHFC
jgi:hypothetical protein